MITSANTSINKNKVPAIFHKVEFAPGTRNLDLGGGKYDIATEYLATKGVTNVIYDPYNRPESENQRALGGIFRPQMYDSCTISNVLNVIQHKVTRMLLLQKAYEHLKEDGFVAITVYEGDKSGQGRVTKKDCWQENRVLSSYLDEIKEFGKFKEVYIKKNVIYAIK